MSTEEILNRALLRQKLRDQSEKIRQLELDVDQLQNQIDERLKEITSSKAVYKFLSDLIKNVKDEVEDTASNDYTGAVAKLKSQSPVERLKPGSTTHVLFNQIRESDAPISREDAFKLAKVTWGVELQPNEIKNRIYLAIRQLKKNGLIDSKGNKYELAFDPFKKSAEAEEEQM